MTLRDGRLRRVRPATAAGVIPGQRLPFTIGELYAQYMPPMPTGFAWALRTESDGSDYARMELQGSWLCVCPAPRFLVHSDCGVLVTMRGTVE